MKRIIAAASLFLLITASAQAQTAVNVNISPTAVTVGTTSTKLLAGDAGTGQYMNRLFQDVDPAVGMWCTWGGSPTSPAATRAAPSLYFKPRQIISFGAATRIVQGGDVNCISDSTTASVSVSVEQVNQ